ncbi:MAG TPA: acylphosphatase [Gemmatimonadales bacterium]|jgi:acylphosphatase|nr:acylphosphatase [Gemmatimonadales bacterium]
MPRRFVVTGRVQGVGFRWYVMERAQELGLTGYVLNRRDGTVEVVAEGGEAGLARLAEQLKSGPRLAVVESVLAETCGEGPFDTFEIHH